MVQKRGSSALLVSKHTATGIENENTSLQETNLVVVGGSDVTESVVVGLNPVVHQRMVRVEDRGDVAESAVGDHEFVFHVSNGRSEPIWVEDDAIIPSIAVSHRASKARSRG